MKVPILFPKIFNYPFTYESGIQQKLKKIRKMDYQI